MPAPPPSIHGARATKADLRAQVSGFLQVRTQGGQRCGRNGSGVCCGGLCAGHLRLEPPE